MKSISDLENKNNSSPTPLALLGKTNGRLAEALRFNRLGFSTIPIETDGNKTPVAGFRWQRYQERKPTEDELTSWFSEFDQDLAIIAGRVSGNLAVIDFDEKNEPGNYERWRALVPASLLKKLAFYLTPSGGYHGYCRTLTPKPTDKLARAEDGRTLIELKANGGYVLAPGIQSYGPYTFVDGVGLDALPILTEEEWAILDQAVRQLNRYQGATAERAAVEIDHAEAIETVEAPQGERIKAARNWLDNCPGAQQGRGADGYAFALAAKLLWGFALPTEEAAELLADWGQRPDQLGNGGSWYPWTPTEIQHKIADAAKGGYPGTVGDCLRAAEFDPLAAKVAAIIGNSPATGAAAEPVTIGLEPSEAVKEATKQLTAAEPAPAERKRRGYKIGALRSRPKAAWQIERHFRCNSFGLTYGPSGSYKSFYVLEQGLCTATGLPFLGRYKVRQGPVCYVAGEGQSGIAKRIDAWLKHRETEDPDGFIVIPDAFDLMRSGDALEILDICQQDLGELPSLIIIDTLARNFGGGSENDPEDMGRYVRNIDLLRKSGATVNSVHHTGWTATERERGNNQLRGACDWIIGVAKDAEADGLSSLLVKNPKQKEDEEFDNYIVMPKRVELGTDEQGQRINSLVLNRLANPWLETYLSMKPKTQELLAALHEQFQAAFSWSEAKAAGGQAAGTFNKSWDQLKRHKFIQTEGERYTLLPQTASVLLLANSDMGV